MENKEKLNYCCSSSAIINRLIAIGTAKEKILQLLDADYFDELSKHNDYWDSSHGEEGDKLDECRMRFKHVYEVLWDVIGLLNCDNEDN